jgi:hypothetical protein
MGLLGDKAQVESHFKCTIGLEMVLEAPDGTPS